MVDRAGHFIDRTPTADIPPLEPPETADPMSEDLGDKISEALGGMLSTLRTEVAKAAADAERLRVKAGVPAPTEAQRAETTNVLRDQIRDRILKALSGDVAVKKNADGTPDPDDLGVSLLAAGALRKSRLSMSGFTTRLAREGFGDKPERTS